MLNIESVADDLISTLRQKMPAQVQAVIAVTDTRVPIVAPKASSYFLGEWSRFHPYELPAVFVVPSRSPRAIDGQNIDKWQHRILVHLLIEGCDEESLTRACFRMAEATYACVHDQDITRTGVSTRATKVFVESVEYGPIIARQPQARVFQKDIFLSLSILHYDRSTPMG